MIPEVTKKLINDDVVWRVMYINRPGMEILFMAPDCNSVTCTKTATEMHSCT